MARQPSGLEKTILKLLIVVFTVVLPIILVVAGVWFFHETDTKTKEVQPEEKLEAKGGVVTPSQLLGSRLRYKDKRLIIRGRVSQAPMVCERKECPKEDPCCGCKPERNLVISDPEAVVIKKTAWQLRLLDLGGKAFCQRLPNSCQYNCPGWKLGDIYDVEGIFHAEPPPRGTGWSMYFDFYFEVERKNLVEKIGIIDMPKRFLKGIQELIEEVRSYASYYVL